MPCAVVDEKGDQVVDENGHPVFRRACEVAGHASGEPADQTYYLPLAC